MNALKVLLISTLLVSCATIPKEYILTPSLVSQDPTYGYNPSNPIKVGGIHHQRGPANEREYLSNLRNLNNERPRIYRAGSCCSFQTPNSEFGSGLLDIYELTFNSTSDTVVLYLNMYDYDQPKAPVGFLAIFTQIGQTK